ncbi:PTS mannose/fructose/sorbose/N-acetylgalactosamine transporter subunit IIC [Miniphocaeibacter massiliensis]|uniref:PTS mannose/fructose/sorbose/N-acetylgalactosamine transporter subunit IIC n=1 Tax=Miniphocaeibacter massiliensis TaxID=2041841 RepID=UPI000C1BF786|nr:PTS sugar transporter subunit IIC [Miniphocaeibacter massiliensis]
MFGDYSFIQVLLVFIVTFIAAIDQFSFLESLYQPIVMGPVIGAILGDVQTGLIVGGTYQLLTIGNMPIGGAQPPNAVMGGIMATVFAIVVKLEPGAAAASAIPFALLGQYAVTLLFTFMSPMMTKADKYAENADTKGITKINILSMVILGTLFGIIVLLFFAGGAAMKDTIADWTKKPLIDRFMKGLSAAGGMMKYVGFAMLLKVMLSRDLWGFFFGGFALAIVVSSVEGLASSALILLAILGFMLAFWDYQVQTKFKNSNVDNSGGDEDGI